MRRLFTSSQGRRAVALVAPLVTLWVVLAACGEASSTSAPTATPEPTATTVAEPTATEAADAPAGDAEAGRLIADGNGCLACHSIDGSDGVGPTWLGLFGSEEQLSDGSRVTVDADFIRRSVADPDAQVTEGFDAGLMPKTFADTLSDKDVDAIIAFMQGL